jgi:tetratricopeptide (TPR) repeat protein
MRLIRLLSVVTLGLVMLSSCNRDPNVLKKRYVESGNKYYDRAKYREAILMYRDALQKDKKYAEAHYRLGLAFLKMGGIQEGVRSLRRAKEFFEQSPGFKNDPHYWDAVVRVAQAYITYANRDKSLMDDVDKFSKLLLEHDANSFDGHHIQAQLLNVRAIEAARNGLKDDAKDGLEAALKEYQVTDAIKPNQTEVQMEMAGIHAAQGDYKGAEDMLRKIVEHDKTFVQAYVDLYTLAVKQQRVDMAESVLKEAYRNNPKQFIFLERLAMFYWLEHRTDDMQKALAEIKSHANEYANAYLDVGDFYYRQGDGDAAIKEYKEGMGKDPKHRPLYQKHMIEVLWHMNRKPEAATINEQILNENPSDTDAKSLDATLKLDKGDVGRALTELVQVVTQKPDNMVAHFNLGRAYAMRGEWESARQQFDKAIELRPDYLVARVALAQLQASRGDFPAAIRAAQGALAVDPNNLSAHLVETASLIGQKKYADARTMLDAVLVANPNSPDVLFQLALVNMAENKFREAETMFRKVYELNPANPRGMLGLTENFLSEGKTDQALNVIKTEIDKSPTRLDLQVLLADTASRTGRFEMALQNYQHVIDSLEKGSKQRAELLVRIGEVYRRQGKLPEAIASLQKAREIQPESMLVLVTLGLTLDQAKQWTAAKQVYETALKVDPNNGISLNNLAFLEADHGGELSHAQTLAQRAKQMMPNRPEVADTLGWIYLKRNLPDNAVDIFRDLVSSNPHASTFRYHLCQAYNQKGDKLSAVRECTAALRENPPAEEMKDIKETLARVTN